MGNSEDPGVRIQRELDAAVRRQGHELRREIPDLAMVRACNSQIARLRDEMAAWNLRREAGEALARNGPTKHVRSMFRSAGLQIVPYEPDHVVRIHHRDDDPLDAA